jgi:hypothetical protein
VDNKAYFDKYSENYKNILANSTGEDIEAASFFASQKVSHITRSHPNRESVHTILDYGLRCRDVAAAAAAEVS